jgi:hypothetical protein
VYEKGWTYMDPPVLVPVPVTEDWDVNVKVVAVGTESMKKFPCVLVPRVPETAVQDVDVMGVPGTSPWFVVVVTVTVVPD